MKPARLRPQAEADLQQTGRWYFAQGGEALATRFLDDAFDSLEAVERMPGMGSPRLAERADVPGLRCWSLDGFPCFWCYFVREDHLDVVRLLGERQQLPADWMA